jgi:hypothetical protein
MRTEYVLVSSRVRNRIVRPCSVCHREFSIQPSKVHRIKSCPSCRHINRKPPARLSCQYCGEPFTVKGHLGDVQKYCSRPCKWNAASGKPRINYLNQPDRPCLECGTIFGPTKERRLYCSMECFRTSKRRATKSCAHCGGEFNKKRHHNEAGIYFCSRSCHAAYFVGANHPLWNEDRPDDDRGLGWEILAENIRLRDDYLCQRCGRPQQPTRKHDVHHIEPYRVAQNNDPENLITLCPSCHKTVEHSPWALRQVPRSQFGTTPS